MHSSNVKPKSIQIVCILAVIETTLTQPFKARHLLRGGGYNASTVSKRGKDMSRRGISVVGGT